MARRRPAPAAPSPAPAAATPLTLVVDSREQAPYSFAGVAPVVVAALPAGDYSILGHEQRFAVERKSLADLFGTVIGDRDRFERELSRLATYDRAYLLVEGTLRDVLDYRSPHWRSLTPTQAEARPRAVVNSLNTWSIEHGIHVLYADRDRDLCRTLVYRLAERYWRWPLTRAAHPSSAPVSSPAPSTPTAPGDAA